MGIVTEISFVKAYFYFINGVNGQFLPLQKGYGSNYPLSFIAEIAEAGPH